MITYTLIGLVAAVSLLAVVIYRRKSRKSDVVSLARKRAEARVTTRAFSDTIPEFDPYRTSLQFQHLPSDFCADLTDTQVAKISNALGIDGTSRDQTTSERTQFMVSGYNISDIIEPQDPWKDIGDRR